MPLLQRKWSEAALLKASLGEKERHFLPSTPFKHLEAYVIVIILNSTLKHKLFWMETVQLKSSAFCVPTSAVEDMERRDVLVMQRSAQTGVYCRNVSLFVSILQKNTKPHPWMIHLYFSAVYLWNKYNYNCEHYGLTQDKPIAVREDRIYKKKRCRWRNNQIKDIWKRTRTLKRVIGWQGNGC